MTDPDLARRAVRCKRWRRMPGMRLLLDSRSFVGKGAFRVHHADASGNATLYRERGSSWDFPVVPPSTGLPDLDDPATLGCLLALVREAWGLPTLAAVYCEEAHPGQGAGWAVQVADCRVPVTGPHEYPTEAAALVAALEAAP